MTPSDVVVGSSVVITDSNNHRIQVFTTTGQFQSHFGDFGTGSDEFISPFGIGTTPGGDHLVADTFNNRVKRHDSSGSFDSIIGQSEGISLPQGVVADDLGNIFVSDTGNNRVLKFGSNGSLLAEIGGPGLDDGQFIAPRGLALDNDGNLLVVDSKNHRIQKFDPQGNFMAKFGEHGQGNGQFEEPFSVAVDSQDRIYVSDSLNNRLQIFSALGEYRGQLGRLDLDSGSQPGEFDNPLGIGIGPDDALYVADGLNDRIQVFVPTPDGDYNGNGTVEASDYALWLSTLGEQTDLRADGNENGRVDPDDYGVWKSNLGIAEINTGRSSQIPEPPASVLVLVIATTLFSVIRLPIW